MPEIGFHSGARGNVPDVLRGLGTSGSSGSYVYVGTKTQFEQPRQGRRRVWLQTLTHFLTALLLTFEGVDMVTLPDIEIVRCGCCILGRLFQLR